MGKLSYLSSFRNITTHPYILNITKSKTMIYVSLSRWWSWLSQKDEYTVTVLLSTAMFLFICFCKWVIKKPINTMKVVLPPGPRGLPIVGNLPFLDPDLHICFRRLSEIYGPIFKVQLGSKLWIVITSPSLAREVLKVHDTIFANHDPSSVAVVGTYGGIDMVWSAYGAHWRRLRKVCVQELLTTRKLDELYGLRRREVRDMVNHISSNIGQPIEIGEQVFCTSFQIITSMLWGGTLDKKDRGHVNLEFRKFVDEVVKLLGEFNVSDIFPVLAKFDLQGKERKMKKRILWFEGIFSFVLDQRLKGEPDGKLNVDTEKKDFLQVLLEHKESFTMTYIKALLMDMIIAGTRTSSTTVEWAMAEMLRRPDAMRKVQEELEQFVGINNVVEESHLHKLKFLDAVVRETLRLHPPAPLLIPRAPSESCIVGDYMVPKGATVVINSWAIQRDPQFWNDPLEFKPERFLESGHGCDYKGTNYSYVPFGSGRRVCPGIPLAERMIPYLLASLLQFNWKLPEGEKLDLTGKFGLELQKRIPLVAIPTPR